MKIVLISPHSTIEVVGIRILSACLKKEGFDVSLIFLPKVFIEKYDSNVLDDLVKLSSDADLIGITVMTNYFMNVVQISKKLRSELKVPILWGGIHPTIRPTECLMYADMVCIGEAEETIVELAKRIENKQDYFGIPGVWFKSKDKIIKNEIRPLQQNLDSFPFQDYDFNSHYILDKGTIKKMNESLFQKYTNGCYTTIPSRGCPFGCTYCCNNTFNKIYGSKTIMRKRSIANIIEELKQIKNVWHTLERIEFSDDNFFIYSPQEIKEFSIRYKKEIGLPLMVMGISPRTITAEKLSYLANTGLLKVIRMGIQTASNNTQQLYKRSFSNQEVEKAVKIIDSFKNQYELVMYDIILDNPFEKDEDIVETLMFLSKLPVPYKLYLFSLNFYPGTELYELAKKEGIISDDIIDVYGKHYTDCKKTYLNGLFLLLNKFSIHGGKISPRIMYLLTNKKLRQLKLNWVLYFMVLLGTIPYKIKGLINLLSKGVKETSKGNWNIIVRYVRWLYRPKSVRYKSMKQ